jgi:hypothetical protein
MYTVHLCIRPIFQFQPSVPEAVRTSIEKPTAESDLLNEDMHVACRVAI